VHFFEKLRQLIIKINVLTSIKRYHAIRVEAIILVIEKRFISIIPRVVLEVFYIVLRLSNIYIQLQSVIFVRPE
jgi:hypothetical protein